ncbi:MAG: SGNH/GDSL hydrolase family protein [Chloroflexi bacterium]|nr:SGNH/GDSL hydrolase family protein [Chloroflexota bacterium]
MNRRRRFVWMAIALVALALAVEGAARLWLARGASEEQFARYAPYPMLTVRYGEPPLDIHRTLAYTGVANVERGPSRHNALGFRGPEVEIPKPEGVFRIVVLGGSAVYGAGVADDADSFPALLAAELARRGYPNVEVVNTGVLEYSSWEDLFNFEFRVLDLEPDLALVQAGYEDIAARLVWPPEAYRGDNSGYLLPPMPFEPPGWERSAALRIAGVGLGRAQPYYDLTVRWRLRAASAYDLTLLEQARLGTYPSGIFSHTPVDEMLAANRPIYFENNMQALALSARVNSVPLVFITTPAYDLFAGGPEIASAYQGALDEHNAILAELAEAAGGGLFDLAAGLPGAADYFADATNLSAAGNAEWARLIADYLIAGGWLR